LRNKRIAREFAAYYDLYKKYKQDYRIQEILDGGADSQIKKRAANAPFDERLSLMGLLLESVQREIRENVELEEAMRYLLPVLKEIKTQCMDEENTASIAEILQAPIEQAKETLEKQRAANALSREEKNGCQFVIQVLQQNEHELKRQNITKKAECFAWIKQSFDKRVDEMKVQSEWISQSLHHLFTFVEQTFGDGNELLVLVTELTVNYNSAKFIAGKGCEDYYKYNQKFMLHERNKELLEELEKLQEEKIVV
jgi:hypothetical protein